MAAIDPTTKTALDLITGALRKIGQYAPGETLSAEDSADALGTLNDLLDVWSMQHLTIYNQVETVKTLTAGQASYTIGTGGDFNMTRPLTLQRAYSRVGNIDFPCQIVTLDKYAGIGMKSQPGPWPKIVYFDANVPLGTLYFWPVPTASAEFHMWSDEILVSLDTNDVVNLPRGYFLALQYGLAELLCSEYGIAVPDAVKRLAKGYRDMVKSANATPTGEASIDAAIVSSGGHNAGWYLTGGF